MDKALAFGMEFESIGEQETDMELFLKDIVLPPNWGCCCNNIYNFPCELHDNIFPKEENFG